MLRKSVLILLRLVGKLVAVGALALLGRGEGVVVSIQPTVRLGAELGLEGGELLRDAEEAAHLHAQDHPNDICRRRGTHSVLEHTLMCTFPVRSFHQPLKFKRLGLEHFFTRRRAGGAQSAPRRPLGVKVTLRQMVQSEKNYGYEHIH